jgi:hypothetical protein
VGAERGGHVLAQIHKEPWEQWEEPASARELREKVEDPALTEVDIGVDQGFHQVRHAVEQLAHRTGQATKESAEEAGAIGLGLQVVGEVREKRAQGNVNVRLDLWVRNSKALALLQVKNVQVL